MNIDEKKLKQLQDTIPILNELDVLESLWNSDIRGYIFDDLCDKYLIDNDECYFSEESEEFNLIKPYIIEWFGDDYALAMKDEEYIMLCFALKEDDIKYWDISKINTNNQEMARKVAYLISFVSY